MRRIGQVETAEQASRLIDYLLTKQIESKAIEGEGAVDIWAVEEDRIDEARVELAAFNSRPDDPQYAAAADAARQMREKKLSADIAHQKRQVKVRRSVERPTTTVLTVVLAVACCSVSLLTNFGSARKPLVEDLLISETMRKDVEWHSELREIESGEVWRLFTPVFPHGSPLHLLFNMMWLWQLGRVIEYRRGPVRYAAMTVTIAVLSNLVQFIWAGPFFYGYSGIVSGLFGYAVIFGRRSDPAMRPNHETEVLMLVYLFAMAFVGPRGIANAAHLAGLFVGMAIGFADSAVSKRA